MADKSIEVPRDKNLSNDNVTKDIEYYLLDLFSKSPEETFHTKELLALSRKKFSSIYGWDLLTHVDWALDSLHFNKLIKRVAPATWENIDGPDEIYSERETGHAEPGEYSQRGYNVASKSSSFKSKADFNAELRKTELSVKMLKNMGWNEQRIVDELSKYPEKFNSVVIKIAIKKLFKGVEVND